MDFHGVDVRTQFKKMRELAPEAFRAFLEFDQKAFKDGAIPAKTKELIALGIAHITQCPWCIDAHTKKAAAAGAADAEIAETTFVAMAMAAGAHGKKFRGRRLCGNCREGSSANHGSRSAAAVSTPISASPRLRRPPSDRGRCE